MHEQCEKESEMRGGGDERESLLRATIVSKLLVFRATRSLVGREG